MFLGKGSIDTPGTGKTVHFRIADRTSLSDADFDNGEMVIA
jgi:hypothetical protein